MANHSVPAQPFLEAEYVGIFWYFLDMNQGLVYWLGSRFPSSGLCVYVEARYLIPFEVI